MLSAVLGLAGDGGELLTGRLDLDTHPWLADHTVLGAVLLPGTAFVELALRAGVEVGCDVVSELVLEAPLILGAQGGVQLQVSVGQADESGTRALNIYSRRDQDAAEDEALLDDNAWVRHATGVLAVDASAAPSAKLERRSAELAGTWPPADAEAVNVDDLYDRMALLGYDYGPTFQGLRAAWRRGPEVFVEIALPADQQGLAGLFGIHPALLDASLHALGLGAQEDDSAGSEGLRLPFSWNGVKLYATGGSSLRAHLSPVDRHSAGVDSTSGAAASLLVSDDSGELVASVDSLVFRELTQAQLAGMDKRHESLFCVDWVEVASGGVGSLVDGCMVLGGDGVLLEELREAGVEAQGFGDLASLG